MATKGRIVIAIVAGVFAGGVIGAIVGFRFGTGTTASHWATTNAQHTVEVIETLRHLRAGREREGIEQLESHLNRHVFGLMPSSLGDIDLDPAAGEQIRAAISLAREYRANHPHEGQTALDRDVRRFLARD